MKKTDKPILLVDFDGVLHSYTSGWQGAAHIEDPPVPGAKEFLLRAMKFFRVCIYSSRSRQGGGIEAMKNWLYYHAELPPAAIDRLEFPTQKPAAFLTIDDRAYTFMGLFPDPEELLQFRPWNYGERAQRDG